MTDDQLFGVIASVALLIWLLGRGSRRGGKAELVALGLVGAGIVYALVQTVVWFTRS